MMEYGQDQWTNCNYVEGFLSIQHHLSNHFHVYRNTLMLIAPASSRCCLCCIASGCVNVQVCLRFPQEFVQGVDGLPQAAKESLKRLTPATYIGNAAEQARQIVAKCDEITVTK